MSWCGLISFDELNEKLNTSSKDDTNQYDWGSFGDDAIYKFLSANATPWNNGDNTRQLMGRQRFYLLDDSKCPIPGKSYKDLTPKQIEAVYKNYSALRDEIQNEDPNYKEALIKVPEMTTRILADITNGYNYKKLFKDQDPKDVFKKLMSGEEKLNHNDQHQVGALIKMKDKLSRGIRTPGEILETYMERQTENLPEKVFSL